MKVCLYQMVNSSKFALLSLKAQFKHNCPRNIRPRLTSFKAVLNYCDDFEMSHAQLPAFYFEIGVSFFEYYYFLDSKWKQTNLYNSLLTYFFPVFAFIPSVDLRKTFQGL